MSPQIFRALSKHQQVDSALQAEQLRVLPNIVRLQQLKRMKLSIKDKLHRLSIGRRANVMA